MRVCSVVLAALASLPGLRGQVASGARQPRDLAAFLPLETALLVESDDLLSVVAALRGFAEPLPWRARLVELVLRAALKARSGYDLEDLVRAIAPGPVALAVVVTAQGKAQTIALSRTGASDAARTLSERVAGVTIDLRDGLCAVIPAPEQTQAWQRFLASDHPRLAGKPGFRAGQPEMPATGLRIYLDLALVRRAKSNRLGDGLDPGGLVLLGPLAVALDDATRLDATLTIDDDEVRVQGTIDGSALDLLPASYLLACKGGARAGVALPADALASLSLDRSLRGYLTHLDALLPAATAAQVRSEAANFDQIIGGASFVVDVLAHVDEPLQLLVVGAPPVTGDDDAGPRPRIDLPGFALVGRATDARARRLLTQGFFRLSAVLSAQRLQRQLPARVAVTERDGDLRLHVMRGAPFPGVGQPPTEEQIEATLVFTEDHFVVATTPTCARQVVAALAASSEELHGDVLRLRAAPIADYVRRNRAAFVAGRVLDEGESTAAAEGFVRGLLDVLDLLAGLDVTVVPGKDATAFDLVLRRSRP